jgi:hypothetical protein
MIFGGNVAYGGWENEIGDFRAPSATAYGFAGYMWGPLFPSAGLTVFGKFMHDRQRGEERPNDEDPLFMIVPTVALEWASDYVAFLLYGTTSFSYNGFESVALTLGVTTSLF